MKQERKDFYEYPHSFNDIPSLEIVQIIQTRQEKQEFYTGKKGKRQKHF